MSISASIELFFEKRVPPIHIIESLIKYGWSTNDNGHISYLPVGDDEDYDWNWCDVNKWNTIVSVIDEKDNNGETIGVALTWKKTNIGGELLIWRDRRKIWFSLTLNRKSVGNNNLYTDFSWYINKLTYALCESGLQPNKIVCEHVE